MAGVLECINVRSLLIFLLLLYGSFFLIPQSYAQVTKDSVSVRKNAKRKVALAGGAYALGLTGVSLAWYGSQENFGKKFSFFNDNAQWYGQDKLGHAWTCYHLSRTLAPSLAQVGVPKIIAAYSGALLLLPVEILDGLSPDYGFSWGDFGANFLGSTLYFFQNKGKLHFIRYKFQFWPSPYAKERPELLGANVASQALKDYNGQTYWLLFDLKKMIRPKEDGLFLLALGHSVSGLRYGNVQENKARGFVSNSQWLLSIGLNGERLFRHKARWARPLWLSFRLPAPALMLARGRVRGWWLYPIF